MRKDDKTFYHRLLAAVAAALVVLVAARLLFFPTGKVSPANEQAVIQWQDANKHYGEYCTVEGRVVSTYKNEKVCFLDFGVDRKRSFTAVIFASSFEKFPPQPEVLYRGKKVRVTGAIRKYESKPEIVLDSPDQIQLDDE